MAENENSERTTATDVAMAAVITNMALLRTLRNAKVIDNAVFEALLDSMGDKQSAGVRKVLKLMKVPKTKAPGE